MAKAGVLAFDCLADKRMDKLLPSVYQLITRLGGHSKLFIIPVGHMSYHHSLYRLGN